MSFKLRCVGKALLVPVGIAVLGWMVMTPAERENFRKSLSSVDSKRPEDQA
ncbi:hypothetical protein PQQ52_14955 [Paraburkholderia sediminicola]|uniref:hypothetical protein n=1 Tax=Paraburkholderia sediminicola TaxID=458836 RepID=UPI0038BB617A